MKISKEEDLTVIDGEQAKGHMLLYREEESWITVSNPAGSVSIRNWTGMSQEFYNYLMIKNTSLWDIIKIRLFRQKYKSKERRVHF